LPKISENSQKICNVSLAQEADKTNEKVGSRKQRRVSATHIDISDDCKRQIAGPERVTTDEERVLQGIQQIIK